MAEKSNSGSRKIIGILKSMVGLIILGVVIFLLGPRVDTSFSLESKSTLPTQIEDLESFLSENESKLVNLSTNAVKEIVWAYKEPKKTDYSLVYLHGFTAMKTEVSPLTQQVANQLQANIYYHRFTGHGSTPDALANIKPQDWLRSGLEALEIGSKIGEKLIVIATSNGASIASVLACRKQTPEITALFLISPNIKPRDPRADVLLLPWGTKLAEMIAGKYQSLQFNNEEDRQHWTSPYPTKSAGAVLGITKILRDQDLSHFKTSTMIFMSPDDKIVDPIAAKEFFDNLSAKDKRFVIISDSDDPADHVLAGDLRSPSTTKKIAHQIINFIKESNR